MDADTATFIGSNEMYEIETLQEFHEKTAGLQPSDIQLAGWVFQGVDLSSISLSDWQQYSLAGANFWGCTFPASVDSNSIRTRGARVLDEDPNLPFKMFRSFLYTQDELQEIDVTIYEWYKASLRRDHPHLSALLAQNTHDYSIRDALYDFLEGKSIVSIMGGHSTQRASELYRNVALLGWLLAREGFIVATGGGPGAMEATNLGAYMYKRTKDELFDACDIISTTAADPPLDASEPEYKNKTAPRAVLAKYGPASSAPSLGIPTWKYGHEPPNMFASLQAKFFSNAVREDLIIEVTNAGMIFTPGSAGTRQEIFQDACRNHYADVGASTPMVFYPAPFWQSSGLFDLVTATSAGKEYHSLLLSTESIQEVVAHLVAFRTSRNLPILST